MDELNLKIIRALQINARKKLSDIAKKLNVAQSTVFERVKRLENDGFIKGYTAILDLEKFDYTVQALISVVLSKHDPDVIEKFYKNIRRLHGVRSCYHVSGRFDYFIHVAAKNLTELKQLVMKTISSAPGFIKSETFVIFSEIKPDDKFIWVTEANE
jgi:DNA-binding Lrp family transcriptional regulator